MARRAVKLLQTSDFTGGLNLRDDTFQLDANETSRCLNVILNAQGGVHRRRTVELINSTATASNPLNIWSFIGNGVTQIVIQTGSDAAYSTGGNFTAINPDALSTSGIMRATSMARASTASSAVLYVQRNAEQVPWKWDGSSATVLADAVGAFNEDLAAPNGGNMPKAKYLAAHLGYMFVANTVESGTAHPNRVRFSHPEEPEDWREDDFIEIGMDDDDEITGLASVGDRLYIFKSRSVWVITGYDADTWQWFRWVPRNGAVSQEAIAVEHDGVAFFDATEGVFMIGMDGKVKWLWPKLTTALELNDIPPTQTGDVTMCWFGHRLFVSVPWDGSTVNARTFVYDPEAGRAGAWYPYGYGVGPMVDWRPNATDRMFLACAANDTRVLEIDAGTGLDNFDGTEEGFTSYFRTAWFAANAPGVRKRWRRPTFVVDSDQDTSIAVKVYTDYRYVTAKRTFTITTTDPAAGSLEWGVGEWGVDPWGEAPSGEQGIERGSGLGRAYAVSLEFIGPTTAHWSVNAIDLRYIMQRIR